MSPMDVLENSVTCPICQLELMAFAPLVGNHLTGIFYQQDLEHDRFVCVCQWEISHPNFFDWEEISQVGQHLLSCGLIENVLAFSMANGLPDCLGREDPRGRAGEPVPDYLEKYL